MQASWSQEVARLAVVVLVALTLVGCGKPMKHVTDNSHFLSDGAAVGLNAKLEDYERRTHHQVIVWIEESTEGVNHRRYSRQLFNEIGFGRKRQDDGAAIFVFTTDGAIEIMVGYGLESALTNTYCAEVYQERMRPLMVQDPAKALNAGVDALIEAIDIHEGRQ